MQKFLPIKKSIFIVCLAMMLCWIPVTAHAAGHREAPTSPTRILFVGNSYTQRNHMPNIFSETVQEFRAERDRKVTHQSGTFPEKYKQSYNCQRQKTLPASAYAAMGLRHFAGSTLLSDFQTTAYEKNHPQAGSLYSGQRCKDGPLSDMGPGEMA